MVLFLTSINSLGDEQFPLGNQCILWPWPKLVFLPAAFYRRGGGGMGSSTQRIPSVDLSIAELPVGPR